MLDSAVWTMTYLPPKPKGESDHQINPACWPEQRLLAHCRLTFSRASGPGGQNRNKVETSVQIEFLPSGIIASASERRTQNENRKVAIQRLRCKLAVEIRPSDGKTASVGSASSLPASEVWKVYCRDGLMDISEFNTDWPSVLAEVIGSLRACDWNIASAASMFGTSSSQLVKLLKKYPPAFSLLNEERKSRGQRPMG